jgi:poly(3-hydroxybutyrate) depolymerase
VWSIAYQASDDQRSEAALLTSSVLSQLAADTNGTLLVNGYARNFVYAVSGYAAPATGRPLVIHLHGDGGNMGLSAAWKNAVLDDANGAVLLSAQGRNNIPDAAAIDGSAWRFRMDEAGMPYDDVDFIDQLITAATANDTLLGTLIDPNQVYVVGESRGAGFAYVLYADPRTRNKIRAIVPISGTFYCEGDAVNSGTPGTPAEPNSDTTCGEVSAFGFWGPKASLFSAPGVTRAAHILDIHGQLPPNGSELQETAPPALDQDDLVHGAAGIDKIRPGSLPLIRPMGSGKEMGATEAGMGREPAAGRSEGIRSVQHGRLHRAEVPRQDRLPHRHPVGGILDPLSFVRQQAQRELHQRRARPEGHERQALQANLRLGGERRFPVFLRSQDSLLQAL